MDIQKLKIKIGEHEFEAEGPTEVVQAQFAAFKELIGTVRPTPTEIEPSLTNQYVAASNQLALDRILKEDGRVVSLTARCESVDEAVLLILFGQKELRSNQEATGAELMDGLKQSGYRLARVDSLMNKLTNSGDVITLGVHRGRRYKLTNAGVAKAREIAKEVIATVP
jgi:hypothetical protein